MEENKIIQTVEKMAVDDIKKIHKDYGTYLMPICALIVIIVALLGFYLVRGSIKTAAESVSNDFEKAKNEQYSEVFDEAWQKAYNKNRLSQEISIFIGDIQEISKLEVLKVSEQSYTIQDKETKNAGITYWTKNTVFGIYTVDLSIAEFIVDNKNNYILVRIPEPSLTVSPSGQYETKLYRKTTLSDGNNEEGSELAKKQLKAGEAALKKKIETNQSYKIKAKESAEEIIKNFIYVLNPDNDSLTIEIEYLN